MGSVYCVGTPLIRFMVGTQKIKLRQTRKRKKMQEETQQRKGTKLRGWIKRIKPDPKIQVKKFFVFVVYLRLFINGVNLKSTSVCRQKAVVGPFVLRKWLRFCLGHEKVILSRSFLSSGVVVSQNSVVPASWHLRQTQTENNLTDRTWSFSACQNIKCKPFLNWQIKYHFIVKI